MGDIKFPWVALMKTSPNFPKNLSSQKEFTAQQLKRLDEIEQLAIAKYMGDLGELESALGMLRLGHQYGWRVMVLIHSKSTIRKYEQILGIDIREEFPERGPAAHRSAGLRVTDAVGNFWKAVSGDIKIPKKREID